MLWISYLTGEHEATSEPVAKIAIVKDGFTVTTQSGAIVGRDKVIGFQADESMASMMTSTVDPGVILDKLLEE